MYKFKFADIGEGLHEGVVGEIYKNAGDDVKEGDSLFSVETDKVTSDIPSPVDGKISKVLMALGDTITVGDVIYHIDDGSGDAAEEAPAPAAKAETPAPAPAPAAAPAAKVEAPAPVAKPATAVVKEGKVGTTVAANLNVKITPFARSLAAAKGINLAEVKGTGFDGRILVKDIESFTPGATVAATATASAPAAASTIVTTTDADVTVKITGIRKAIAGAMKQSWASVAYTNLVNEVNMTKLWDERKTIVESILKTTGVKLTFTAFAAKATAIALKEFPMLNAKYDEANNQIVQFGAVNLGMAVDTAKGLMVPVIKNADKKSLIEIARDIKDLGTKARDGKLKASDMQGGTFTLTNYGSAGAMYGVPVINVGEMGIIGTGVIVDRVYARKDGTFYNGKVMHLTGAADHRWVDGADIGRFISRVKELLENPLMMGSF